MRDTRRFSFTRLALAGLLSMLLLALVPAVFGQTITTGDVAGITRDTSGAVVPNATITLKSTDTGDVRTMVTGPSGEYRFTLLKPGDFTISAAATGLKSNVQKFTILVGQAAEMNLTLAVTSSQQVVEVQAEAPALQTDNANIETNFNKIQVDELPMPGGDLTTLAMTAPGIRVNVTGGSSNMNANGIPGASILYTLDGMDQNDPANNINNSGASNNLLGANAVGEVAVVMNAYSPEYGRMAGAQVNMVGMSGTNQFHGNLFYNFNWEQLNANSFFANSSGTPRGRSDAHQFGGRVGGPVWKNKLFFFFDDENLRYVLPAAGVVSLPSPAAPGIHPGARGRCRASSVPGLFQPGQRLARNQPRGPGNQWQRRIAGRQQPPGMRHQQLLQNPHGNGRDLWRGHSLRDRLRNQRYRT